MLNEDLKTIDSLEKEATPMKSKLTHYSKQISALKHQVLADRREILARKQLREEEHQAFQVELDQLRNALQEKEDLFQEATAYFNRKYISLTRLSLTHSHTATCHC